MAVGEWLGLAAAVAGGGAVTAMVNGAFSKRKAAADAESVAVANALALVEPYRKQVADVREETGVRLAEVRAEMAELKNHNTELRTELRLTRIELAQLMRRERENIERWAQMNAHVSIIRDKAHQAGIELPPTPEPPQQRREFTRISDLHIVIDDEDERN